MVTIKTFESVCFKSCEQISRFFGSSELHSLFSGPGNKKVPNAWVCNT